MDNPLAEVGSLTAEADFLTVEAEVLADPVAEAAVHHHHRMIVLFCISC